MPVIIGRHHRQGGMAVGYLDIADFLDRLFGKFLADHGQGPGIHGLGDKVVSVRKAAPDGHKDIARTHRSGIEPDLGHLHMGAPAHRFQGHSVQYVLQPDHESSNTIFFTCSRDVPCTTDCFLTFPCPWISTCSPRFSKSDIASIPLIPITSGTWPWFCCDITKYSRYSRSKRGLSKASGSTSSTMGEIAWIFCAMDLNTGPETSAP